MPQTASVPFYCVRAVTDLAGESLANDFNRSPALGRPLRYNEDSTGSIAPSDRSVAGIVPAAKPVRPGRREHWENLLPIADSSLSAIPETMHAAVYRGESVVNVEEIPTPAIGPARS